MKKYLFLLIILLFGCDKQEKVIYEIQYEVYFSNYYVNVDISYKNENGIILSENDILLNSSNPSWIYEFTVEKGAEVYLSAQKLTNDDKWIGISIHKDGEGWQSTSTDNPYGSIELSGKL